MNEGSRGSYKLWEPWEDKLALACPRTSEAYVELAERIGRTPTAVAQRRHRLGPIGRSHERWSPDEDALVLAHYMATLEFRERLGRGYGAIMQRGRLLAKRDALHAR